MLRFAKGSTAIDFTGPGDGAGRRSVVIGDGAGPRWVCRQLSISDLYAYTLLPARCMWRCTGRPSSVSHRWAVRTPRPRYAATSFQESRRSPGGGIIVTYICQKAPKSATCFLASNDACRISQGLLQAPSRLLRPDS